MSSAGIACQAEPDPIRTAHSTAITWSIHQRRTPASPASLSCQQGSTTSLSPLQSRPAEAGGP